MKPPVKRCEDCRWQVYEKSSRAFGFCLHPDREFSSAQAERKMGACGASAKLWEKKP